MTDSKNLGHNSKKDFLKNPVEHIDITSFDSRKIISSMEKMSFVSRETANAANIYNEMLKDKDCTIFLTLAGSTSAAGCPISSLADAHLILFGGSLALFVKSHDNGCRTVLLNFSCLF